MRKLISVKNVSAKAIDRMTEVALTLGELEVRDGGLDCNSIAWTLAPGATSPVIEVKMETRDTGRYAYPGLRYPCGESAIIESPESTGYDDLGDPLPPAVTAGSVMIEVRGLFTDASPWTLEAAVQLE